MKGVVAEVMARYLSVSGRCGGDRPLINVIRRPYTPPTAAQTCYTDKGRFRMRGYPQGGGAFASGIRGVTGAEFALVGDKGGIALDPSSLPR